MAGFLGSDFDPERPEDSDSVKLGAGWIRDLKARVQRFAAVMFNLESGTFRDNVVRQASLTDSITPGTFSRVRVNSKGLAEAGLDGTSQQVAGYWRALFSAHGSYFIETASGIKTVSGDPDVNGIFLQEADYSGSGAPFSGVSYTVIAAGYSEYSFNPPAGVRRVKATIIGGGGGGWDDTVNWFGGGGADLVETIIPVDGTGTQSLKVIVGQAGGSVSSGTAGDGCPSRVELGATVYADACPGKGASSSAGGDHLVSGSSDTASLAVLRSAGTAGAATAAGASGSTYFAFGGGGGRGQAAGDGGIILEWLI